MAFGSALGIIGFATVSGGFIRLAARPIEIGLVEIGGAVFLAIGVLAPLRQRRGPTPPR
jgi:hypothetical protein